MKKVILVVALFVPIAVFIFFKIFGKNEFEVPVYWSGGVSVQGCPPVIGQYTLPDSVLAGWGWKKEDKATLLLLDEKNGVGKNLARISDLFEKDDYATIKGSDKNGCLLLAGDSSKVLMIDDQKRIRGYYTPTTQKETDRLEVELKILLKKY